MNSNIASTESAAGVEHPRMSWGAVIAGWAIAVGMASLLYIVGLAVGLSVFDPERAANSARGMGIGTAIWMILTWVVSLFLGGMFASWFDGKNDTTMGTMHGVTVWGLAVVMSGLLLSAGIGHAMNAPALFGDHMGSGQANEANVPINGMPGSPAANASADIQAQLELGARSADGAANATPRYAMAIRTEPGAIAMATDAIMSSQPQTAKDILVAYTAMTPPQIDVTVANATARAQRYQTEAKALATRTAKCTSAALWVVFLSTFLGLLASALGGCLGAARVHRVYHLRTYRPMISTELN
ncbi:hypothetical protein IHE49_17675 [Rhodanobacter sp. 7MK24]|uniref:hypothetical protein n=1 Tax=Rhodanobacter sp. 7MK24 TaxID=2775922 RepID=UPI0017846263|nr:hypothetical protein [Rhodanobacter sp. 7MK24]MBD8882315.1 hypothetical protein [Rhodanobacter sp. 7MK24]